MSYLVKAQPRADGIRCIARPGTAPLQYLEFSVLALAGGRSAALPADDRETVVYLLSGRVIVAAEVLRAPIILGPRRSVFADPPWAA